MKKDKHLRLIKLREKIHACSALNSMLMLELYQKYLAELLNADQVVWCAAYKGKYGRDLWHTQILGDWKIFDIKFGLGTDFNHVEATKKYFKIAKNAGSPDPQMMLSTKSAGQTRVHLLYEATTPEVWNKHWMKELLAKFGVGERMVGAYALSDIAEGYYMVDRPIGAQAFTQKDKSKLLDALLCFPRLHYWLFLLRGLVQPATRPLSPREREVLGYLLTPYSEVEIAEKLSLTKGTIHNYVIEIYKVFKVNSRHELMQIWLQALPNI